MKTRQELLDIIKSMKDEKGETFDGNISEGDYMTNALGFDSLDMVALLLRVEQRFEIDPFKHFASGGDDNFGEFVKFCAYEVERRPYVSARA